MAEKKGSAKGVIYIICCIIVGAIIGTWLGFQLMKPQWQKQEDKEISANKEDGTLDWYILERYIRTLAPNGQIQTQDSNGEVYSYQDLYDYDAKITGYICTQLSEYADNKPKNEIAKCEQP